MLVITFVKFYTWNSTTETLNKLLWFPKFNFTLLSTNTMRILCLALMYGSEGCSFFSGYTSSKYSLHTLDSYTTLLFISKTGTRPRGFLSINQSGLSLVFTLTFSCLQMNQIKKIFQNV